MNSFLDNVQIAIDYADACVDEAEGLVKSLREQGYVIVPLEPTEEMLTKARYINDLFPDYKGHEKLNTDIYKAMTAAYREDGE